MQCRWEVQEPGHKHALKAEGCVSSILSIRLVRAAGNITKSVRKENFNGITNN